MAPRPKSAPLTTASIVERSSPARLEKSGATSLEVLALPFPPEDSPPSLLISSKLAKLFPAFLAEAPTPSSAFFSSFRFSAAAADSSTVVPKMEATTEAMALITWVST